METQKMVNLLKDSDNENSKFATKKWFVIASEANGNYSHHNPINFLTKSKSKSDSKNVLQKLMVLLLMKQILLILQCLCII